MRYRIRYRMQCDIACDKKDIASVKNPDAGRAPRPGRSGRRQARAASLSVAFTGRPAGPTAAAAGSDGTQADGLLAIWKVGMCYHITILNVI